MGFVKLARFAISANLGIVGYYLENNFSPQILEAQAEWTRVPHRELPNENDSRYIVAHQEVFNPLVALLGQSTYALVCLMIYWLYRPVTPDRQMSVWIDIALVVFGIVALFDLAYLIRRPGRQETIRFWRKVDKRIPMAFDIVAVGVLLLLYPFGHSGLQILTVAFFVGYVPLQMISDPENAAGNRFSTVTVLGSFALTLAWNGGIHERVLAFMMVLYGTVLFISSSVLRRVVISAVDARLESERNAAALEEALADVSASRDAKTRFIAAAAHDLGQPLTAASLFFGQVMRATSKPQRESAAQGVLDAFVAAEQLLSHMLNHLSLKADAVKPRFATVKAGDLVRKVVRQFEPLAKANGMELRMVPSHKTVHTDPELTERVIGNYLSNAIVHSRGDKVLIGARPDGPDNLRIWVFDNGQGVPESEAPRIFDEYYRGAESIAMTKGGFGIGLASARRIAMLIGGEAGIDQLRRRGAAFYLKLPRGDKTS